MSNNKPLGRLVPPDDKHLLKYPLMASTMPTKPVPVTVGVNWYSAFDNPVKDRKTGQWWAAKDGNLGRVRGGHCVVMPHDNSDLYTWYLFYNQGLEGACVGFGSSRAMSLLNRKRYDARWLYHEAQRVDYWPGGAYPGATEFYEGTTVRAAMDVLRAQGHKVPEGTPALPEGIAANRWAMNIDDVLTALGNEKYKQLGAIPFLNSWGKDYPQRVWMPCEVWARLLNEWGEFAIITDR